MRERLVLHVTFNYEHDTRRVFQQDRNMGKVEMEKYESNF